MKKLVFILLMMVSFSIYGQTELPDDSIATIQKLFPPMLMNEELDNYLQLDKPSELKFGSFKPDFQPIVQSEMNRINAMIPQVKNYSYPTIHISSTNMYMPLGNDYSLYATYPVGDNMFVSTYSGSHEYLGLGAIRRVDAQFGYEPTDWMSVSAGSYVSKYALFSFGNRQYDDYGLTWALRFKAGDRIRFNGYGQYGGTTKDNKMGAPMSSMFNPTYYGGTVEFKVNDNWGIEAGMLRELNPFTGKWTNTPIIAPVFYGGKRKK